MTSVVNGIGNTASVDYKPMADTSVYTQQPKDGSTVTYPLHAMIDGGRMLVSALHVDNGGNTPLTNTYAYEGLATDPTGRGEQGFERVTITDPLGTVRSTQYAQGFPYTGMELGHTIVGNAYQSQASTLEQACNNIGVAFATPGTGVLEQSCNVLWTVQNTLNTNVPTIAPYARIAGYDTTVYPYVQNTQVVRNDLNGTGIAQTNATVSSIDNWGNVTGSTVQTQPLPISSLSYATSTANQYNNMPNNAVYRIGELTRTVVTKTSNAPGLTVAQATMWSSKQFGYYGTPGTQPTPYYTPSTVATATGAEGLLQYEIAEPDDNTLSVQTTYGRDGFGNVNATKQIWQDPQTNTPKSRTKSTTYLAPQGRFPQIATNALGQSESYSYMDATGAKYSLYDLNALTTVWMSDGFGRIRREIPPDGTETDYAQKQCGSACPNTAIDGTSMRPALVTITDHVLANTSTRIAVPEINYGDTAGHHLRNQSYGFDGTEIDTDFIYDNFGRLQTTYQPAYIGGKAYLDNTKVYDELNRVVTVTTDGEAGPIQEPEVTTTFYNGLMTTIQNPAGQTKSSINNAIGQLVQTIDALGNATNFTRDAKGNLVQTTDSAGNVVTIQYDNLNRKVKLVDPDLGTISYKIDPIGRQYQQVNPVQLAKGQSTTFVHDALDRLTQRIEPDLTSNWVFDQQNPQAPQAVCIATASCGKLIEAYTAVPVSVNPSGKDYDRTEIYDNLGRPKSSATTLYNGTYTSTNTYDNYGRASTVTHQSGTSVPAKTYAQYYNGYGYLAQVARIDNTTATPTTRILWQANKQDAADRVTQAALGNGLTLIRDYYTYTARLQDTNLTGAAGAVLQEGYSYDKLGNVNNRNEYWGNGSGFSENFGYDIMNRLATSQVITNTATTTQSYKYNDIGNLIDKTGVGSCNGTTTSPCYAYPPSGPGAITPHAVSNIPGLGNFTYDANGNMQTGAGRTETWTSFDMPVQILGGNGSYSQFVYGPEHQRTRQVSYDAVSGKSTTLVYADAMEADITNGVTAVKTYWPMGLGVEIDVVGGATPPPATALNWTHSDRLGSIVAVTDVNGNLEEAMAYDAWGARRDLVGTAVTSINTGYKEVVDNKGFTGQEELDKLALVHLNGRIYDPFTARFISADPLIQDPEHSQSYNRYSYVWNNPTNLTDPSGFGAEDPDPIARQKVEEQVKKGVKEGGIQVVDAEGNVIESVPGAGSVRTDGAAAGTQQAGQGTSGGSTKVATKSGGVAGQATGELADSVKDSSWRLREGSSVEAMRDLGYKIESGVKLLVPGPNGETVVVIADNIGVKGTLMVITEVKDGLGAKLSAGQKALFTSALSKGDIMIASESRAKSLGLKAGVTLLDQSSVLTKVAIRLDGTLTGRAARQIIKAAGTDGLASMLRPLAVLGGAAFFVVTELGFHTDEVH